MMFTAYPISRGVGQRMPINLLAYSRMPEMRLVLWVLIGRLRDLDGWRLQRITVQEIQYLPLTSILLNLLLLSQVSLLNLLLT
jgi:hypothetical protein